MSKGASRRRRLAAELRAREEERLRRRALNPVSFDLNELLKDAYFWENINLSSKSFRALAEVAVKVSLLHEPNEEINNDTTTGEISGELPDETGQCHQGHDVGDARSVA